MGYRVPTRRDVRKTVTADWPARCAAKRTMEEDSYLTGKHWGASIFQSNTSTPLIGRHMAQPFLLVVRNGLYNLTKIDVILDNVNEWEVKR